MAAPFLYNSGERFFRGWGEALIHRLRRSPFPVGEGPDGLVLWCRVDEM